MELAGCRVDKITFGSVIHASAKSGDVHRAAYWIEEMFRRRITPNIVCFNTALHACARSGDVNLASLWFQKICAAGIEPNKITFNCMIDTYAKVGDIASVEMWLRQMVARGIHPDQITYVTLLRACPQAGDEAKSAEDVFWAYSVIVKAFAIAGNVSSVKRWLGEMARHNCLPTFDLRNEILEIIQKTGDQKKLAQIHQVMSQRAFAMDPEDVKQQGVMQGRGGRNRISQANKKNGKVASSKAKRLEFLKEALPVGMQVPKGCSQGLGAVKEVTHADFCASNAHAYLGSFEHVSL
jgi:pentatricopeptide repeat protein